MIEWLLTPIDIDRVHQVGFFVSWHGRFMVFAWGFLIPVGIIAARYFKIMPKQNWPTELDNKAWWHTHRVCQYGAALFMSIGTVLILYRSIEALGATFHTRIGWLVIGLAAVQILSGIYRGTKGGPSEPAPDGSLNGDHFDMTKYRVIFEYYHKTMGYLLLGLATYCIISGMWTANAYNWMWICILGWWAVLIIASIYLQIKGACFDTYQSIWGPDKSLPGNQMKPIGLGISTYKPWQRKANKKTS